jgi:hypothetical protein
MGWIGLAGAALGGIAGSQGQRTSSEVNLGPESALGAATGRNLPVDYEALRGLVNAGAGSADVAAGAQGQRDLAAMLKQFSQGGFLPGQQDIATANQFAQSQFQPQQVALQQQQKQEQLKANQLAAQLGRPVNDPIIQAKLAQERMQSQERLGASQGAFASQFALNLPQQRLGYTAQLADVQNALASQAMSNRQALVNLGSQLRGQEQQFRLGSASRSQTSGGGLAGGISGALAGFGAFSSIANSFRGGGGGDLADMSQAEADALQADYENQAIASRPSTPQIQQLSASRFSPQPQTTFSAGAGQLATPNWGPLNNQSYNAQYGSQTPFNTPGAFSQAWRPGWSL